MKQKIPITIITVVTCLIISTVAGAETHYVTQNGGGAKNGNQSDPFSISQFNSSTYWNAVVNVNDNKIGPGDIVKFLGAISEDIEVAGSGTSGHEIILDGAGATFNNFPTSKIDNGYWDGIIRVHNKHYIKIQNWKFDGDMTGFTDGRKQACIAITSSDSGETGRSSHITIDNNTIKETDHGIVIHGHVEYVTITRNLFRNIHGNGVSSDPISNSYIPNNITVGGAKGMGNEFHNVGWNDVSLDVSAAIQPVKSEHITVSYNHYYNDSPAVIGTQGYGMGFIYANDCRYILVEYNITHNFYGNHMRSPVVLKGDTWANHTEGPIIVRFNHFYNSPFSFYNKDHGYLYNNWGQWRPSIYIAANVLGAYIYGNKINNAGGGVEIQVGSLIDKNIYVFNNVISDTQYFGIADFTEHGGKLENAYIFNNTLYNTCDFDAKLGGYDASAPEYSGLHSNGSALSFYAIGNKVNFNSVNNLVSLTRMNDTNSSKSWYAPSRFATYRRNSSSFIDYEHYYKPGVTPKIVYYWWDSASGTTKHATFDYNASRPNSDGLHDSVGNPRFYSESNADFRLTSSSPTSITVGGYDLKSKLDPNGDGYITCVTIGGKNQCIPADFALGPNTVYHKTDPDGIYIDARQQKAGQWSKGAYVLKGSTQSVTTQSVTTQSVSACSTFIPGEDWCAECGPCQEGEGDCDGDSECAAGIVNFVTINISP